MMKHFICLCIVAFSAAGCSPSVHLSGLVPAAGVVLHDGKPVEGALVSWIPLGQTRSAVATTDTAGQFKMMTLQPADGVQPGQYAMTVTKTEQVGGKKSDENAGGETMFVQHLPMQYADPSTSGLTIIISAKGDKNIKLELTGEIDTAPQKPPVQR